MTGHAEENTQKLITLAHECIDKAEDMRDSAALCLEDARELLARGLTGPAQWRALRSLQYSVGVLSPIYNTAASLLTPSQS